jgi:threonine dehydrogenase-like Zn-dependent dehydrogenase
MANFTVYKGSKEGKIVKDTTSKEIGPDEVLVRVQFSGLCGTDVHYKSVDMVLGHEASVLLSSWEGMLRPLKCEHRSSNLQK